MVDRTKSLPVIVEMRAPEAPFATHANARRAEEALELLRVHGRTAGGIALLNAAAGFANAAGIEAISRVVDVEYVYQDALVRPRKGSEPRDFWAPGQLSAPYPRVTGADKVWLEGTTGRGVAVAVLDSGIAPHADLTTQAGNRIVAAVDFAGQRDPLRPDPGGHGTHVAGIIAGDGALSSGEYVGMAPRANLVDVRVLNQHGNGRVSSVVRGIEWVLAHREQYNIRVLNLSFGAPPRTSYRIDPMTSAVEIAWRRGVVVVAAAGNGGPNSGTVESPGIDPYAITVGATDDRATLSLSDDLLAWFSAWGTPPQSTAKPNLVAPGRRIVSLRAPGSYLDTLYPDRVVVARNGSTYFRLTGTSMSTPMVAGAVALLLERQPGLAPDQVKAILTGTVQSYGEASGGSLPDPSADGAGLLNAYAAVNSAPLGAANQGLRPADGFARALYMVLYGQPLRWKDPYYQGRDWNSVAWDSVAWDSVAWDNFDWDSVAWDSVAWDSVAWDSVAWDSVAWDSVAWDSVAWDSLTLD